TFRSEEFEYYKANRDETPEDIKISEPIIRDIIEAFNIPILEVAGYEADDVIGTLAKKKAREGYTVYMVTPDKDFAQLVEENILIYKPGRKGNEHEILGVEEVKTKWKVEDPVQVIDILGLWGDSVDNIPGIPGIGEKTAQKLIAQYQSVEGIIANVEQLKGKQKENVETYAQQGLDSKRLATIVLDVPVDCSDEALTVDPKNTTKLAQMFQELEFRTLGVQILGDSFKVNEKKGDQSQLGLFDTASVGAAEAAVAEQKGNTLENTEHEYTVVETFEDLEALVVTLSKSPFIVFDTETSGLNDLNTELVGLSFSIEKGKAWYIPVPDQPSQAQIITNLFQPIFEDESIEKIGQNLKFDINVLSLYGIEVKGKLYDTMLAHYVLEPDKRHNMDYLSETFLGYSPMSIEALIGKKGKHQKSMRDVELEKIAEYAAEDADITLQLKEKLAPIVAEIKPLDDLLQQVEFPLVPVLAKMEQAGVNLDTAFLADYSAELTKEIQQIKLNIFEMAGTQFNLDSPKQMGEILFGRMDIPYKGKKTKTGQFSTNEATLTGLKKDHEIIGEILEYRQIAKLKSTYVDALPALINERTGRVHTTFGQAVAATGRLSSVNPNLQNIPIRTERGRRVRKAFIPQDSGHVFIAADYSQIELRLVAALSEDEVMINAFKEGQDIHTLTASKVFNVSPDAVTREMRSNAKTVNFGIIYGVSAFGLSQQTNLSRTESKEIIDNYFATYPQLKAYMDNNIELARSQGYVETILGRRRYLPDINSNNRTVRGHAERNAINAPVQGSAADLVKVAMINVAKAMDKKAFRSKMVLQVHDELLFDTHQSEIEELKALIIHEMENAFPNLSVPMIAEVGIGQNWLEAH
ncbi:MAG: DNA polymerase I, partial [Saprospiraceae bacterium]|nr:DNA polymerase I [Saprospiraceae bacterium]